MHSVSLAVDGMAINQAFPQILHCDRRHRRRSWRRSTCLRILELRDLRRRRLERDDLSLFGKMIQHDGLPRGRIGDDRGIGCIDPHFPIAGTDHTRWRLHRRSPGGGLHGGDAIGATGRTRRQWWKRCHGGQLIISGSCHAARPPCFEAVLIRFQSPLAAQLDRNPSRMEGGAMRVRAGWRTAFEIRSRPASSPDDRSRSSPRVLCSSPA